MTEPNQPEPQGTKDDLEVRADHLGWIELTVPTKEEYLSRLEEMFEGFAKAGVPEDDLQDIKFVVREICENAMEWGNRMQAARKVHVSYRFEEGQIFIRVRDEGEGFNPAMVPDPGKLKYTDILADRRSRGKRVGGLGLFMVRKIMDEVSFNDKGNEVFLRKRMKETGSASDAGTRG